MFLWLSFGAAVSRSFSFEISISINNLSESKVLCSESTVQIVFKKCLSISTFSPSVVAFLVSNFNSGYSIFSFAKPRIFLILCQSFEFYEILIFFKFIFPFFISIINI